MSAIRTLMWTDLYKLTMNQAFFHQLPNAGVAKYRFKCRNGIDLRPFKNRINMELDFLCQLKFEQDELEYLRTIPFLKDDYIDYLEDFTLKRRYIHVDETDDNLDIWAEGPLLNVMMFEVYVLALVHDVYTRNTFPVMKHYDRGTEIVKEKIEKIVKYITNPTTPDFKFADFGTRRAFTTDWHDAVIDMLDKGLPKNVFVGTSNVKMAMEYGLKPIGTFAHEYVMAFQGIGTCTVADSQKEALQVWANEYRGNLGIALSDTLGTDKFIRDFDLYFAKLYDGVRHDSGCPFEFTDNMIQMYNDLGIDPKTKTIVFSDGLDLDLAFELNAHCDGRIGCSFGIGTSLTNCVGIKPLQNVMKMVEINGRPVAKISDNPEKGMCEDKGYQMYLHEAIKEK